MTINGINSFAQDVQKIDDDFYVGRIPGRDLSVVMERVNKSNIKAWSRYAKIQTRPYVVENVNSKCDENGIPLQKGSLAEGSGHFEEILETVPYDENEVWVAYITKAKAPEKIPANVTNYDCEDALNRTHTFAKDIEMFVSITTSPEALITSHMGVASSIEGVGNRSRGTSVDLHSFAAKVMLIRNPKRKYMVNAPADAMEMIFAKSLPGSFHAGTLEMQRKMEKRQSITLEAFTNELLPKKSRKAQEIAAIDPFDKRVMREECLEGYSVEERYHFYKNPYPFKSATATETKSEEFLKFMEKHPPILSSQKEKMTIFNPLSNEPDLTIHKGDKRYKWTDVRVLKPCGTTHYVVVDLLELAQCKKLEG